VNTEMPRQLPRVGTQGAIKPIGGSDGRCPASIRKNLTDPCPSPAGEYIGLDCKEEQ